jgi:hypothetical protein
MTAVRGLETGSYVAVQMFENIFKETVVLRNKLFASLQHEFRLTSFKLRLALQCIWPHLATGKQPSHAPVRASGLTLTFAAAADLLQSKSGTRDANMLLLAVGVNGRHENKTAKNGTRYFELIAEDADACTEKVYKFQNVNTLLEIVHPSNVDASGRPFVLHLNGVKIHHKPA